MRPFAGFPASTRYAGIPAAFFSDLLPAITDEAELRVSLHLFWLLSQKQGRPKAVLRSALLADRTLAQSVAGGATAIERGLKAAAERGTFLVTPVAVAGVGAGTADVAYLVNTPSNRRDAELLRAGKLSLTPGPLPRGEGASNPLPLGEGRVRASSNIFQLYEDNIGLITPILAEELREAEARYPANWIEEAFRLAVERNRRRWSYIAAILERWTDEGFPDASGMRAGHAPARG
jgi:DnaD/phage-associated family protein